MCLIRLFARRSTGNCWYCPAQRWYSCGNTWAWACSAHSERKWPSRCVWQTRSPRDRPDTDWARAPSSRNSYQRSARPRTCNRKAADSPTAATRTRHSRYPADTDYSHKSRAAAHNWDLSSRAHTDTCTCPRLSRCTRSRTGRAWSHSRRSLGPWYSRSGPSTCCRRGRPDSWAKCSWNRRCTTRIVG